MRVTRNSVDRRCAICERTLLMGERTVRFRPNGNDEYVHVCSLCQETAVQNGWVREGAPTTPTVASEPVLRRLSEQELAMVEAADQFNTSQFRRTVGGIAKSLGVPRVSVVPLSGVNQDVVVTVAWEISWYQYRITADSPQPVRLAERGQELGELEESFTEWNA